MKKVIVTGTRGFIGVSLMKELDKLGYLTHGFDDSYLSENNWTEKLLQILETLNYDAVFHSGEEEVVIRLKGTLTKDGKKEKELIVEESSSEVSMSTLIVDEGGSFNQTSLSNALKKASEKLINKLIDKK